MILLIAARVVIGTVIVLVTAALIVVGALVEHDRGPTLLDLALASGTIAIAGVLFAVIARLERRATGLARVDTPPAPVTRVTARPRAVAPARPKPASPPEAKPMIAALDARLEARRTMILPHPGDIPLPPPSPRTFARSSVSVPGVSVAVAVGVNVGASAAMSAPSGGQAAPDWIVPDAVPALPSGPAVALAEPEWSLPALPAPGPELALEPLEAVTHPALVEAAPLDPGPPAESVAADAVAPGAVIQVATVINVGVSPVVAAPAAQDPPADVIEMAAPPDDAVAEDDASTGSAAEEIARCREEAVALVEAAAAERAATEAAARAVLEELTAIVHTLETLRRDGASGAPQPASRRRRIFRKPATRPSLTVIEGGLRLRRAT